MINDDKTFCQKVLTLSAFLCLVIKSFITVYNRYAIFLRPISPSTEILELQALINYCCIIVVNRTVMSTLQPKTNRCNSDFSFIKIRVALYGLSSLGKVQYKHL